MGVNSRIFLANVLDFCYYTNIVHFEDYFIVIKYFVGRMFFTFHVGNLSESGTLKIEKLFIE